MSLMKPVAAAATRAPQHMNQRMLLDTLDSPQVTVTQPPAEGTCTTHLHHCSC